MCTYNNCVCGKIRKISKHIYITDRYLRQMRICIQTTYVCWWNDIVLQQNIPHWCVNAMVFILHQYISHRCVNAMVFILHQYISHWCVNAMVFILHQYISHRCVNAMVFILHQYISHWCVNAMVLRFNTIIHITLVY